MDPEDRYGLRRQCSGVWRSFRDTEFQEEDIWDVLNEKQDSGQSKEPSNSVSRHLPTAAKMIPRTFSNGGGSSGNSSTNSSHEFKIVHQQSAPLNIPDWSKISQKNKKKASKKNASNLDDDHDGDDQDSYEDDEDEEYNSRVPPHELIARRRGRSQISSFSVFEGAGRTLKGRDLSKMRNAILTKTGFLESL